MASIQTVTVSNFIEDIMKDNSNESDVEITSSISSATKHDTTTQPTTNTQSTSNNSQHNKNRTRQTHTHQSRRENTKDKRERNNVRQRRDKRDSTSSTKRRVEDERNYRNKKRRTEKEERVRNLEEEKEENDKQSIEMHSLQEADSTRTIYMEMIRHCIHLGIGLSSFVTNCDKRVPISIDMPGARPIAALGDYSSYIPGFLKANGFQLIDVSNVLLLV
jgi:hypothetical protein